MKILLTGATGLLGRRLLDRMSGDHELVALCRSRDPEVAKIADLVTWDLTSPIRHADLPERVDAVIHLAQSAWFKHFPQHADDMFLVNVASTAGLLDYGRRAGAEVFLLASSGNVYSPYRGRLTEDEALHPVDFYGASKAAAEALLKPYLDTMATCALRLFCLYGSGQRDRLIPNLADRIRADRPIALAGTGGGLCLTPTFVDDVAALFATAVSERWTGPLNVAAPYSLQIRDLAETIGRRLGKAPVFEHSGGEEPAAIVPDLTRLRNTYGIEHFRSVEDGLSLTFAG